MGKLLGYKLKEEEYREAAKIIVGMQEFFDERGSDVSFDNQSYADRKIKEAGVMHWFEEVYEEEKPKEGEYWFHSTGTLELILEYNSERDTVKTQPIHTCISTGKFASHGVCTMDRKATEFEKKEGFIKAAKKRGFKDGVTIKSSLNGTKLKAFGGDEFIYERDGENTLVFRGIQVLNNGQWAEIIQGPKTDIIEVGGHRYKLTLIE